MAVNYSLLFLTINIDIMYFYNYRKSNTYNYSCVTNNCMKYNKNTNKDTNKDKNNNNEKNAICSVVQFGNELGECTNQEDTITNTQLNKISNNKKTESDKNIFLLLIMELELNAFII